MLLTRSPLNYSLAGIIAFDLHVLGTPPALILSQDQTLMLNALLHGGSKAAAWQLINASVDDLALLALLLVLCRHRLLPYGFLRCPSPRSLPERLDAVPSRSDNS